MKKGVGKELFVVKVVYVDNREYEYKIRVIKYCLIVNLVRNNEDG